MAAPTRCSRRRSSPSASARSARPRRSWPTPGWSPARPDLLLSYASTRGGGGGRIGGGGSRGGRSRIPIRAKALRQRGPDSLAHDHVAWQRPGGAPIASGRRGELGGEGGEQV